MKTIAKNKIRELKIDFVPHDFKIVSMLIFFNILILVGVIFLVFQLNHWIVWILDIAILAFTPTYSYFSYKKAKHYRKYILYENALVIDTRYMHAEIDLTLVESIKKKRTWLDRIFNKHSNSLEINLTNGTNYDVTYLDENVDKVIEEIWAISKKARD